MTECYGIILVSQLNAYPHSYPVAEEGVFQTLDGVTSLNQLVKNPYDRQQYAATLCDAKPDARMYKMVNNLGISKTEHGAIYLLKKLC
jgi:hypothetical protein